MYRASDFLGEYRDSGSRFGICLVSRCFLRQGTFHLATIFGLNFRKLSLSNGRELFPSRGRTSFPIATVQSHFWIKNHVRWCKKPTEIQRIKMDSALPVLSNVGNFEEETETLSSNGNDFDFVSVVATRFCFARRKFNRAQDNFESNEK